MFNTVVIDPPWPISMAGQKQGRHSSMTELPYQSMSLPEISKMPIRSIANTGAHIYLWCTNRTLRDAFGVMESWQVSFHQALVTVKTSGMTPSMGWVFGTEFCLLGFAGKPMQKFISIGQLNWWQDNPRNGKHSAKPQVFYDRVRQISPGPYADIFARKQREGWAVWGNEVESDEEIQSALGWTGSPDLRLREEPSEANSNVPGTREANEQVQLPG